MPSINPEIVITTKKAYAEDMRLAAEAATKLATERAPAVPEEIVRDLPAANAMYTAKNWGAIQSLIEWARTQPAAPNIAPLIERARRCAERIGTDLLRSVHTRDKDRTQTADPYVWNEARALVRDLAALGTRRQ